MNNASFQNSSITVVIPPEYDGMTLEHYLKQCRGYSRRMLTRLKQKPEYVLRSGVHMNLPEKVFAEDEIVLTVSEVTYTLPSAAGSVPIVYEDDDIILYNKPYGMPIHPSRNHLQDTLANVFTADMQAKGRSIPFRVLNRLDRDTDGLCLCAKNAAAAHNLSQQQQNGSLKKEYTAILCGKLPCKDGHIEAPIARTDEFFIDRAIRKDGQYAKTGYRVIAQNRKYTAVRVNLFTGRTHQIRVHFSSIGYPLAGDTLYGSETVTDSDIKRHALCCSHLSFAHPSTGQKLSFSLDLPDDIQILLNGMI